MQFLTLIGMIIVLFAVYLVRIDHKSTNIPTFYCHLFLFLGLTYAFFSNNTFIITFTLANYLISTFLYLGSGFGEADIFYISGLTPLLGVYGWFFIILICFIAVIAFYLKKIKKNMAFFPIILFSFFILLFIRFIRV